MRAALPDAEQSLASAAVGELRMRKTTEEVDALRRAGQAIDRVHARMAEFLRPGRTEREAGREIAAAILEEGHVDRRLRHRRLRPQRRVARTTRSATG